MLRFLNFIFLLNAASFSFAQELFPLAEPASTVPRNALVVHGFTRWYNESGRARSMAAFSVYYGITKGLMIRVSSIGSNHHSKYLPADILGHTHAGSQTYYYTQTPVRGKRYPFLVNGVNIYAQYRFYNKDGDKKHFRLACYTTYSTSKPAHDEAEPDLWDDNAGWGLGFISTYLKNRKAISFSMGYIFPEDYEEFNKGVYRKIQYGNAQKFSLSLGYLLSPREYLSYAQTNTNIYLEIIGKNIHQMTFIQDNEVIPVRSPAHRSSFYLELHPGYQKIFDARLRVDFSIGLPFIHRSFAHFTPLYELGVKYYFL